MRAPRSVNFHTLPSQHAKGLPSAGRGISLIKYGHRNPPKDIAFGDGHVHYLRNDYQSSVVLVTDLLDLLFPPILMASICTKKR
ncbi:MAG: hypothetical protein K2G07_02715 [Muribaculaceae bacterium]|nr:hypothetical protein [Muribaculaceae bacterium]